MPTLQELLQLQADAINAGMSEAEMEKARKDAEEALIWKDNLAEALTLATLLVTVIFALPSPLAETHQPNVQWRHRLIISAPVFLWRCTTATCAIIAGTLFICLVVNFHWLPPILRSRVKAAHVRMIQRICFLLILFATITRLILSHHNEYIIYAYALCIVIFVFTAALILRMLIRRCLANQG